MCVGHTEVLCKMAEPIEMRFGADSCGSRLDWSRDILRKWATAVVKSTESLCCGVRSKRDYTIVNNGTTSDVSFRQNSYTIFFGNDFHTLRRRVLTLLLMRVHIVFESALPPASKTRLPLFTLYETLALLAFAWRAFVTRWCL